MKEVEYEYFIDGEKVKREFINWEYSTGVTIRGNEVHVDFESDDFALVYSWEEAGAAGAVEDKEKNLETLCNILSLVGIGALPGSVLKNEESHLSNVQEEAKSQAIRKIDYVVGLGESNPTEKLHVSGVKHNKFKAPLDIVQVRQFPKALQALALATAYGNKKYEATDKDFLNFKRVPGGSQTYFDAAARHNAERGDLDEESNLPHVIHAVWDMMAALELYIEENGINLKEFTKRYLEHLHMSK
jgi:hypothetical protein